MTNKKITPVTFSDESVERNEQVGVKHINRAAPDSGSGSGSSSGSSLEYFSGSAGDISSSFGGYWETDCNFWYSLDYAYIIENGEPRVTWASVQLTNVQIKCTGIPTSPDSNGVFYVPQSIMLSYLSMQSKDEDFVSEFDRFNVSVPTNDIIGPDGFRVEEKRHEGDKDICVTTHYESKVIILKLFFSFSKNADNTPNVTFGKCEIS